MKNKKPAIRFKGFSEDWEEKSFGELCDSFGYGLNAASKEYDGINKYIRITDIDEDSRNFNINGLTSPDKDLSLAENYQLNLGDVLFARTGASVGKTYIYKEENGLVYFAGFLIRGRIKKDVNTEFIFQNTLTKRYEQFVRLTSQRSGQPGINAQEYSSFSIKLPQIDEQTQIGNFFKNLDNLIILHQRKYEKLGILKKAMLEKMFPKNGADVPETRFKGFSGAWEERKLGEIADSVGYGLNAAAIDYDGVNRYIRITDIDDKSREFNTNALTSPNTNLVLADNYKLNEGDILFARTGASVGKSYYYKVTDGLVYFAGFLIRVRLKSEFDTVFIFQNTLTNKYDNFIKLTSQRSGQPGVNAQEYSDYKIMLPEFEEQEKIGNYFKNLDNLLTLHQGELTKLKNLKKAMLEKMFV